MPSDATRLFWFFVRLQISKPKNKKQKKQFLRAKNGTFMYCWCQWLGPNSWKLRQNCLLQPDCCVPGVRRARQVEIIANWTVLVQLVARLKGGKAAFSNSLFFPPPFQKYTSLQPWDSVETHNSRHLVHICVCTPEKRLHHSTYAFHWTQSDNKRLNVFAGAGIDTE